LLQAVLALYAHGLTTREIQSHLEELYGTEVSPTLLSTITDEDVRLWQRRPLETVYPILYFDCLFVKSRHDGAVKPKAVYVALGITLCNGWLHWSASAVASYPLP